MSTVENVTCTQYSSQLPVCWFVFDDRIKKKAIVDLGKESEGEKVSRKARDKRKVNEKKKRETGENRFAAFGSLHLLINN